jgi:hypothetical protein
MSERHKPHNGRDLDGHHKVRREDVDELLTDPNGVDHLRDDVRLGGAVEDTGLGAARAGERIERLIEDNRDDVRLAVAGDRERLAREAAERKGNTRR